MSKENIANSIKLTLSNMPSDWLRLTTHRLDIYNESLAKVEFLEKFEKVILGSSDSLSEKLKNLPTAFDYIRLGHPLSCLLEWAIAKKKSLDVESVISFSSQTMPILSVLRKNLLEDKKTIIYYTDELPENFNVEVLKNIYSYNFELIQIKDEKDIQKKQKDNYQILVTKLGEILNSYSEFNVDFTVGFDSKLGSVVLVECEDKEGYISEIQHVRRRESIAMTPHDCLSLLESFSGLALSFERLKKNELETKASIHKITNTNGDIAIGSCGLSIQYAIMMGLIHNSIDKHDGRKIKFIVPPNCYGGTNDQARRVAACIDNVEILDLPVDGGQDMVQSVERVLSEVAKEDAVAFIIAEIPTNPRVEVPNLEKLNEALAKVRLTSKGTEAISPVFILDQTFCPNKNFLGDKDILSSVETISYVSGSKFPSGGLCTAGYCVANKKAEALMSYINNHLKICTNEATAFQVDILSKQMPSMIKRIDDAYKNTRAFVDFISETLPDAKINFVSKELSDAGFTPSVFSLDLPTKGESAAQREAYKRDLNLKLISLMVEKIPSESKHCVSYGQLKGCYWTIPATSTQGTTKEGDKDYIVRVAVSADFDLELHKEIFSSFCKTFISK